MHRRLFPVTTALVALSLVVSACGGSSTSPSAGTTAAGSAGKASGGPSGSAGGGGAASPPALTGSLSTLFFGQPDEIAKVRVEQFKKQFPDVKLTMPEGNYDAQKFLTALAGGNPPDLVYLPRDVLGSYAQRGAIVPLGDCISKAGIDMSQFREAAVSQVTVGDQVYGIPEFYNTRVVILNNKALKEAALTAADVDTSDWDGLAQVNKKLTKSSGGKLSRIGFDPKLPEFLPLWARANGTSIISDDGKKAQLDDPKVVEALEFGAKLIADNGGQQKFKAFRDTWDFFGAKNQFASDQLGAFPIEQWYVNVLAESSPDADIVVKPFTDRKGQPLTFADGSAWAISKGAKNPETACWFAKVMTDTSSWVAAAKARATARAKEKKPFTGTFTANKNADEQIFSEIYKPIGKKSFDDAVQAVLSVQDKAFSMPPSAAGAEVQQAWMDATNKVLNGQASAQDALKAAQQEAQAAIDQAGGP